MLLTHLHRRRVMESITSSTVPTKEYVIRHGDEIYEFTGDINSQDVEFWTDLVSARSNSYVFFLLEERHNGLRYLIIAFGNIPAAIDAVKELSPMLQMFRFRARMQEIFAPEYTREYIQ